MDFASKIYRCYLNFMIYFKNARCSGQDMENLKNHLRLSTIKLVHPSCFQNPQAPSSNPRAVRYPSSTLRTCNREHFHQSV